MLPVSLCASGVVAVVFMFYPVSFDDRLAWQSFRRRREITDDWRWRPMTCNNSDAVCQLLQSPMMRQSRVPFIGTLERTDRITAEWLERCGEGLVQSQQKSPEVACCNGCTALSWNWSWWVSRCYPVTWM